MNVLSRLNIGARLGAAFGAVLALTLIVGAFAINRLGAVNGATAEIATNWLVAIRELGAYEASIAAVRRSEALLAMTGKVEDHGKIEGEIRSRQAKTEQVWKRYEATVTTDEERKSAEAAAAARNRYFDAVGKLLAVSRSAGAKRDEVVAIYLGESRTSFNALFEAIDRDIEFQGKGADAAYHASQNAYTQTRGVVIGLLAGALALGAVFAWLITRSITRPIAQAVKVAETVAAGDLTSSVRIESADETGRLLEALQRMNKSLVDIVGQVRNSSDSIATGSTQIATGNVDLSQRTEEQASNLQQTASSMEELTATVKQNAETAQQANQLATGASDAAREGGAVVERVVATMEQVVEAIGRVTAIMGEISNASVEQSAAVAQVVSAVGEMDRTTQQNAALVEESASAAESLRMQAGQLVDAVGVFKLG